MEIGTFLARGRWTAIAMRNERQKEFEREYDPAMISEREDRLYWLGFYDGEIAAFDLAIKELD